MKAPNICVNAFVPSLTCNCHEDFHEMKEKSDFLLRFAHLFVYLQH